MTKDKAFKISWPDEHRYLIHRIEHLEAGINQIIKTCSPAVFSAERRVIRLAKKYLREKS